MTESKGKPKGPRQYPVFWEKAVPIILAILGIALLVLLIVIFGVATGLIGAHLF
jgi:hypothetical protein